MDLKDVKLVKEVAEELNLPIKTIRNYINKLIEKNEFIEGVDYRDFGKRIPTLLSPQGIEKIEFERLIVDSKKNRREN